jgi:hypothetical protein
MGSSSDCLREQADDNNKNKVPMMRGKKQRNWEDKKLYVTLKLYLTITSYSSQPAAPE